MKEPKIIDRGTAAKLYAEGDERVAIKNKRGKGWLLLSETTCSADVLREPCYEFALIDPEPEIVKPEVVEARGGIYMASKTRHADRWKALRASGVPIISTWIDEAGPGESACLADLWYRCINEARSARALIVYREPGEHLKGAFVEVGAALSAGVPVFAVGMEEFSVVNHGLVWCCPTLEDALSQTQALLASLDSAEVGPDAEGGTTEMRWIPVSERLPDFNGEVLVAGPSFGVSATAMGGAWNDFGPGWTDGSITHWMPLPDPPTATAKETNDA